MVAATLVVLAAACLAAFTYLRLERLGRRGIVPLAARAIAWSALGLLLLNVSCPSAGGPLRPLVLLDGSLSMGAPGGRWTAARDAARRTGEVRLFGDAATVPDTVPSRGRSLLGPALTAAAASERPVVVMTDGEIEDADDLPPELLGRASIRLFPRAQQGDLALTGMSGPDRVTAGDTIMLDLEVRALAGGRADTVTLQVRAGNEAVATRRVRLEPGAAARVELPVPSTAVGPGTHALRATLVDAQDGESRTDSRIHVVTVARTPGVVLLAAPGDWDARFLYQTLRDVAQLPVRGFVRLQGGGGRWRLMEDLSPVGPERVRQAARGADLLILKGDPGALSQGSAARGVWYWPSGERGATPIVGDWYLSAPEVSPVAGAFLGMPVDSFPPATQLLSLQPGSAEWVGLTAQLGRRGAVRPAVTGRLEGRVRSVTVGVDGLWRWAFRGGSSEQSYRTWVATTASWLLAGADTVRGLAAPVRPVVQNGRPLVFEWAGSGSAVTTPVVWSGPGVGGSRTDTLRFDGAGRAAVRLPPGEYRYRLVGGGGGTVAVEEYSDELLPSPVTLTARTARVNRPQGRTSARDWLWLFGVAIAALSVEWLARRRLGLR